MEEKFAPEIDEPVYHHFFFFIGLNGRIFYLFLIYSTLNIKCAMPINGRGSKVHFLFMKIN